jgi:tetratricopeptide (TPR) repeat protein
MNFRCFCCAIGMLCLIGMESLVADEPAAPTATSQAATQTSQHYLVLSKPARQSPTTEPQLIERELCRQAMLIAGREGLGLSTRDLALGETVPGDPTAVTAQTINMRVLKLAGRTLSIRSFPPATRKFDETRVDIPMVQQKSPDVPALLAPMEKLSRGDFVVWLHAQGFKGEAVGTANETALPGDEEALLGEMSLLAQFQAVQAAHAHIQANGQSIPWLGALVRGYANLGQLTRFQWNCTPDVFNARAMLYAQRMVAIYPNDSQVWRYRAYALAMAGYLGAASDDLTKVQADAPDSPYWVDFIAHLCNYDTKWLEEVAGADSKQAGLAMFMAFMTVEASHSQTLILHTGKATLAADPGADTVTSVMFGWSGISDMSQLTDASFSASVDALRAYLPKISSLPAGVSKAWQAAHNNPDLMADVADVTNAFINSPEPAEPSWSALGNMLQESNFIHVYQRVFFEVRYWAVDPSDTITKTATLVANHPYQGIIDGLNREIHGQKVDPALVKLSMDDYCRHGYYSDDGLGVYYQMTQRDWAKLDQVVDSRESNRVWDIEPEIMGTTIPNASLLANETRLMLKTSPNSPYAAAAAVRWDFAHVDPGVLKQWKTVLAGNVAFENSLAEHYRKLRQYDEAIPYLKNALAIIPDHDTFMDLANAYLHIKDETNWLATMQQALVQTDDSGLQHAEINMRIAQHLDYRGDYAAAVPYADTAAESGAAGMMEVAAQCHSAVGEYVTANQLYQANADRYSPTPNWFFWCRVTGHGDEVDARKTADAYFAREFDPEDRAVLDAAMGNIDDEVKDAAAFFKDDDSSPYDGLFLVLLYDQKADAANRDLTLKKIIDNGPKWVKANQQPEIIELAKLFQAAYAGGNFDLEQVDKLFENSGDGRIVANYLTAEYLLHHDRKAEALPRMIEAAKGAGAGTWNSWLALLELHQAGIDPYHPDLPTTQPAAASPGAPPAP